MNEESEGGERRAALATYLGDVGLVLQNELRVTRDAGAGLSRQTDGLIHGVGVEALRATEHGRHGLDRRADDVVVGILLGQRPARGLAMRAKQQRARVLGGELLLDEIRPQTTSSTQLGNLHIGE